MITTGRVVMIVKSSNRKRTVTIIVMCLFSNYNRQVFRENYYYRLTPESYDAVAVIVMR